MCREVSAQKKIGCGYRTVAQISSTTSTRSDCIVHLAFRRIKRRAHFPANSRKLRSYKDFILGSPNMRLTGLIPAVLTPFDSKGELALGVVEKQVDLCLADGL